MKEARPTGIVYRLCQHTAGESFDVQRFNVDRIVLLDECTGDRNMMLAAHVGNMQMLLGQEPNGFASSPAASNATTYSSLCSLDSNASRLRRPRVPEHLTLAGGCEREQAEINTRFPACRCKRLGGYIDASKSDVPMAIGFQLETHGLRRALNRAVLLELYLAKEWDVNTTSSGGDRRLPAKVIHQDGLKPASSFESWITWILT